MKRDRLTNEKNKNHTHMKKVGHTLEFPSGIYWWTLKNLKNQNFEIMKKKKKIAGDTIILNMSTKTTTTWGTVPEIRSEMEFFVILGHFLPFHPP